jgi:hypothetical protein
VDKKGLPALFPTTPIDAANPNEQAFVAREPFLGWMSPFRVVPEKDFERKARARRRKRFVVLLARWREGANLFAWSR